MSEIRLLEGLRSLSILPDHHLPLLSVPVHNEAKKFALDVRNESVVVRARTNRPHPLYIYSQTHMQ